MESILKSDVFFFVTTICVFIVTALIIMVLAEVLRITKNIRHITDRLHGEVENFASDFFAFRATLLDNQFGFKPIFDGMKKAGNAFSKVGAKKRKKKKETTEQEQEQESESI